MTAAYPLFPQRLLEALADDPDRTALQHGPRAVACGELLALVRRLVTGMGEAGLGPGRGVAMMTSMTPEGFAANLAAHALGGRVVGLRPAWSPALLAGVLAGGVDAIVGDAATLPPEIRTLAGETRILGLDAVAAGNDGVGQIVVDARPDDIARLNFTSGSTGRPKGCARTYRTFSLAYEPDAWSPDLVSLLDRFERLLVYGSWSMPVMLTFAGRCLLTGGTVVIAERDPQPAMAEAIAQHLITAALMTPPALHRLLGDERRCGDSLRAVVVSGSPASPGLLAAAVDHLGPIVWQGYGQAESGMISMLTPDHITRSPEAALSSVGRPLRDVEVSVRDADDRPRPIGDVGEICVRSPHVMSGYWNDPNQTREVLRDGWLHTRDLGRLDEDGFLRLTGRSRDVIMVNGEVCYAGAIEQVLTSHPDVAQAFVIGVPDERTGESVRAVVVPTGDRVPDESAMAALIRAALTTAHVPKSFSTVREVPVAAGGKPDRAALVDIVLGA